MGRSRTGRYVSRGRDACLGSPRRRPRRRKDFNESPRRAKSAKVLGSTSFALFAAISSWLDAEGAGADQVGELGALLGVEHRVHAGQRLEHGVAQALRALHPQGSGVGGLEGVELVEAQGVGKSR